MSTSSNPIKPSRRVFNRLHEELSLHLGRLYPRYELWQDVSESVHPEQMTPGDAEVWCQSRGHPAVARKMSKYNPDLDTPEEILTRIAEGFRR